jgi:nitrogen fixation protein NifU and related proteins
MYSDLLLDHFRAPRHVGELPPPAITVEVSNPACGDILRLGAEFEGERVVAARYRVRGCTASIAAGSVLAEMVTGLTRVEMAAISASDIDDRLGGLPEASKHAAALCVDGVKALLKAAQGPVPTSAR